MIAAWDRPNGLHIERVRTPLGVIGIIFESRPNVTADAGALCLKAGNAAILRGGSDSFRSSTAIHRCLVEGLTEAGLPADAIQIVPTRDRAAVGEMLAGLDGTIDVIVPRGGKSLVARVQKEARVPVFAHLEGIGHVYVHAAADLAMAKKTRGQRQDAPGQRLRRRRDAAGRQRRRRHAPEAAGGGPAEGRLRHPRRRGHPARGRRRDAGHGGRLDDRIPRRDHRGEGGRRPRCGHRPHRALWLAPHRPRSSPTIRRPPSDSWPRSISAIVLHNASTQFADGGEFGMGAEIGIATGRMHARGPVGVEQLTSFKYRVHGSGQVRP